VKTDLIVQPLRIRGRKSEQKRAGMRIVARTVDREASDRNRCIAACYNGRPVNTISLARSRFVVESTQSIVEVRR